MKDLDDEQKDRLMKLIAEQPDIEETVDSWRKWRTIFRAVLRGLLSIPMLLAVIYVLEDMVKAIFGK